MNENQDTPLAEVMPMRRVSKAWIVPIITLLIGAWIVYHQIKNQGPLITIAFESAAGIEVDKTLIKTRDVDIGVVRSITLNEDLSGVTVTARIDAKAESLITDTSQFWKVTPRVSLSGVSGLSTLLSGPHIAMDPGSGGDAKVDFIALENPPVTPPGTPGLHVTLNSDDEFAYKEGDPIIYKGLKVGEFEDIFFNLDERVVYYNAFIEAPYHRLITENTRFWNVSGVEFELEASGVTVHTGSVETLLTNGVTFGIPEGVEPGDTITQRAFFDIYDSYDSALEAKYILGADFIVLIEESVRGLQVGAPVEYRGLQVGRVVQINVPNPSQNDQSLLDEGYAIPVLITIQPSRVQQPDSREGVTFVRDQITHWIERGMRASLKMGSLLTGALYVDLQHYDLDEAVSSERYAGYQVIPTRSGELAQITQKISALLDSLNELPLAEIGQDARGTLQQITETAEGLETSIEQVNSLLAGIENDGTLTELNTTIQSMNTLLKGYSEGSQTHQSLMQTLNSFRQTMDQMAPLMEKLNQSPNSLIFSPASQPERQPRAAQSDNTSNENE